MNAKCLNCGASLVFDVATRKMKCSHCTSLFRIDEIKMEETSGTMECQIYTCKSCGAELAVNGVESATYCAYCGQPTIVFNRVSQEQRPEYILPFSLSKESAIELIRKQFAKGIYVPQEVKNFEVDRVHGIYIPYWVFDVHYYDKQLLEGYALRGENRRPIYFVREAECDFTDVYLDGSKKLLDRYSEVLEPYDLRSLVPFKPHYLSGFYSDCFDLHSIMLHEILFNRVKELFDPKIKESCRPQAYEIISGNPQMDIRRESYILLPAWFMTFRYKDKPYTMLVNGQNGKVIGTAPVSKKELLISAVPAFIISLSISVTIGVVAGTLMRPTAFLFMLCFGLFYLIRGHFRLAEYRKNRESTTESTIESYAHKRQEGSE